MQHAVTCKQHTNKYQLRQRYATQQHHQQKGYAGVHLQQQVPMCNPHPPAATSRAVAAALSVGAVAAIATAWSTWALVVIRLDAVLASPAVRQAGIPGVSS
jgi:hypothetical protein